MKHPTHNWLDDKTLELPEPFTIAIRQWLGSYEYSKSTYISYKSAINKLLSFLQLHNKDIQDLTDEDGKSLLDWVRSYYSLSNTSMKHFGTVISTVFEFLRDENLLNKNPLRLHKKALRKTESEVEVFSNSDTSIETFLDFETWEWLWHWLCSRNASNQRAIGNNKRDRFMFALLYHSGIRREELIKLKMKHVFYRNNHWKMLVHGKGNKTRTVSVNSVLLSEFFRYRESLGLTNPPSVDDETPILVKSIGDRTKPYGLRSINLLIDQVKKQIHSAVNDYPGDLIMAQVDGMTTHWLRHTNATHRLSAGASLETTKDELGHSNPATTRIYAHTLDEQRSNDAEKLAQLTNKG